MRMALSICKDTQIYSNIYFSKKEVAGCWCYLQSRKNINNSAKKSVKLRINVLWCQMYTQSSRSKKKLF